MFRVRADPIWCQPQNVDGLIIKVKTECIVCGDTVTLQQAGVPQSVQKLSRMRVDDLALANVILQPDGLQPFEVMQLHEISKNHIMHEKLHKFQAFEYEKFAAGSVKVDITTTPCKHVQDFLSTPREKNV